MLQITEMIKCKFHIYIVPNPMHIYAEDSYKLRQYCCNKNLHTVCHSYAHIPFTLCMHAQRERERDRDRERETETEGGRERDRQRERQRDFLNQAYVL